MPPIDSLQSFLDVSGQGAVLVLGRALVHRLIRGVPGAGAVAALDFRLDWTSELRSPFGVRSLRSQPFMVRPSLPELETGDSGGVSGLVLRKSLPAGRGHSRLDGNARSRRDRLSDIT